MALDPVCISEVDENYAEYESAYENIVYYFCSETCKEKFDENPRNFT